MNHHQDKALPAGHSAGRGVSSYFHGSLLFFIVALLVVAPFAAGQEPVSPVDAVQPGPGFDYTVKKGDTLWDLSRRFVGSPTDWPWIWKHNNQIPNPHRIFPGDRIRMSPLPASVPAVPPSAEASIKPSGFQEVAAAPPSYRFPGIEAIGFIRPQPVAPAATISRLSGDKTIAGLWESIWVRPSEGTILLPGQQFVVYRALARIVDKAGKKIIGYPHYLLGIVEIAAVSGESVKAEVVRSFREMRVGDKLMPRAVPAPDAEIVLVDALPGLAGKILRPEEDLVLLGDYSVVFINRGRRDGVAVGQRYEICDPTLDPGTGLSPAIGDLLVLRVEETTATALVTGAKREIPPGAPIISAAWAK